MAHRARASTTLRPSSVGSAVAVPKGSAFGWYGTLTEINNPSITTTLLRFGLFLAGHRFAKGKAARLSRAWAGRYEEALKVPFLRSVVVILAARPRITGGRLLRV